MRIIKKIWLPLIIILAGAGIFTLLMTGEPPERVAQAYRGPLVEVMHAPLVTVKVVVKSQGTVQPGAQVDLVPQVSGVVVWKSSQLEIGGYISSGDPLLRIEPKDYELSVTQAEAQVAQDRYSLDVMHAESEVARQEWNHLKQDLVNPPETPPPLVLQIPQLRAAEARLRAAQARLEVARLLLQRTELSAPFDGRVRQTTLDVGQYVLSGQPIAELYSIEKAEIVVPVPPEDMAWIVSPDPLRPDTTMIIPQDAEEGDLTDPRSGLGSMAVVKGWYAGLERKWTGRIVRTLAEIDPKSRMVHLVIEVNQPYQNREAPLMAGLFVEVEIIGREVDRVRVLPRAVLREGQSIWTVGADGVLHVRHPQVVRTQTDDVFVRLDMEPDEQVITSLLSGVTDGMSVRIVEGENR